MARHLAQMSPILPVIRKVINRDGNYVCSLCRREYPSKVEANNCLNQCWYDVQQLYPVVTRKLEGHRHTVYRCHYCCRDYNEEPEALRCARRCQGERNQTHVREQLLNDLPIEPPKPRPMRLQLVPVHAIPQPLAAAGKPSADMDEDTPDLDADVEVPDEAPAAPKRRTKASFPKPWTRMDARYQCNVCRQLFFTRMEAEGCFNGHFDADGLEKE